ncbi:XrtA/PEP-CTERM system TPR-repeat protein PrsT [Colwellia psychrerythraea]|uniref:TPR domain protein n=1 Tax=Colwellia psychrerythraea (strain 34H / ATCC BAA-681) TaxID=167879 RepID=Q489H8_COLP3|nr:XrtA/PEP-CTERM system TPR-repeat protein PrsT [Colwellia psychrerythraea]AAZ24949.1 TPR domain protein [Colwellia psychrerythraea 34H]
MNDSTMKCIKLAAIVCIAIGLSACSEQKTTQEYILASKVYLQKLEYGAAIVELKNAVRQTPKDAEARYYLAKAYSEQGSYVNAEKELDKAEQFGLEMNLLLPDLVFIKSKLNKVEEVYALMENVESLNDEQYIVVLTYAGITALNNKELERAQDFIAQANTISETSLYSKMGAAYLLHAEDNFSKGIEIIDTVLGESPDFTEALLLKGHLLFSSEQFIQANGVYTKYRQLHPFANKVLFFEVNSLISAGEYEQADVKATELIKRFKNSPLAHQYKAQVEYQKKNYEDARSYAISAAQQGNEFIISKLIAGMSSYQLGDIEQAYGYLNQTEKYLPSSHPIKRILASIKIKLGYTTEGIVQLSALEGLTTSDAGLFQSSSIELIKAGDFENAIKLLDKASIIAPENASVAAQKGMLKLSQNDKTGIASLEHALNLDPNLKDVEFSLAIQYLDNGQEKKVRSIAKKWIASQDNQASGYLLLGIIHSNNNLSSKAEENYQKALSIEPENYTALFYLADIAEDADRILDAVDYYQKVVTILPEHKAAIQKLSRLQLKHNNTSNNVEFLSTLAAKHPKNITLALGLAQNLRLNNELKKAITLLESMSDWARSSQQYWAILGDNYLQAKSHTKAKECFKKVLALNPNNFVAHLRLIAISEVKRNYKQALTYTISSLERFEHNTRLLILKANFELLTGDLVSAKKTLRYLQEQKVSHHLINKFVGELALADKDYPSAIDNFHELYQKSPTALNVMLLARALSFNGQKAEAAQTIESYLSRMIKDHKVRLLLAELYMQFDEAKAIKHLEIINQSEQNNAVVLNNLAMLELKRARPEQALLYAEKAFELKSGIHQISDTYGAALVTVKNFDSAIIVLLNAINQGSEAETTYVNLTKAYLATGKTDKVKALLDSIKDRTFYSKVQAMR